jgi:3',5'-cyclic AMP phosphodiesterase CpdA
MGGGMSSKRRAWLDRLPQPQIATPGNHDVPYWSVPLRLFSPFGRYRQYVGRPDKTAAYLPRLTVRSLNTARGAQPRLDWSKGAINLAAVTAAADSMRVATKALKVFVCHRPVIEMKNTPVTGGVHRGAAAARIMAEGGVDLILTGHAHVPFAANGFSAEGGCYVVGAGTL